MDSSVFYIEGDQAVRIPPNYHFTTDHVFINKIGHVVMITPVDEIRKTFRQGVGGATPDFMNEKVQI